MRAALIALASLALAACGQGGGGDNGAPADTSPLARQATLAKAAAEQLAIMAKGADVSGQAPRATDPAAGPLLDQVFDLSALPHRPLTAPEFGQASDWLAAANAVGSIYLMAGTASPTVSNDATTTAAQAELNVVTYAPEIGRYLDTELAISSAEAGAVAAELAQAGGAPPNAEAADGLKTMRAGMAQTAAGVIATIAAPGPSDAWREARAKALIAAAPGYARLLQPDARAPLRAQAEQAATLQTDASLKAELLQFAAAIAGAK
jgi:hypothetical protein